MKKTVFLLLGILLMACGASEKITVTNVHDLSAHQPGSYIYSLPRTRLAIRVTAVRHYIIPGPYNEFAEQFLGIQGALSLSKTEWELYSISVDPVNEPDPEYYFSLKTHATFELPEKLSVLSSTGLILKPDDLNSFSGFSVFNNNMPELVHFTDLSVKQNYEDGNTNKRSNGALIPTDLPVIKQDRKLKSKEEKALEAANFIIKIRKRRFKLLAGQYEVYPEGKALETSVRELDALEEEYLSLFVGTTYSDTITRAWFYIPQGGQDIERNVICRFSDETGFYEATSASGKPLVLELKNMQFTEGLRRLQLPSMGPGYDNMILYRLPDKAFVRVFYGSTTLLETELKIFQYGSFVPFYPNEE